MIGTVAISLKNVTVGAYFPSQLPIEETLIQDGTGSLTITFLPPPPFPPAPIPTPGPRPEAASGSPQVSTSNVVWRGLRYYLQVKGGQRPSPLRLGQLVKVTAVDQEGKPVRMLTPLETTGVGDVALFSGPAGVMTPQSAT
jgi:hypothetical protein